MVLMADAPGQIWSGFSSKMTDKLAFIHIYYIFMTTILI
jgi:hypothetical protein